MAKEKVKTLKKESPKNLKKHIKQDPPRQSKPEKIKDKLVEKVHYLLDEFERPAYIANFYGFTPIKTPEISKDDHKKAKLIIQDTKKEEKGDKHIHKPEEKICILRTYVEQNMGILPQPVMLYYNKPFPGQEARKSSSEHHFGLDIIGFQKGLAEALAMQTAYAILKEEGYENIYIEINSMGDKQSISDLEREINNFVKKNAHTIPETSHKNIRSNPWKIFDELASHELSEHVPKPIGFLSEQSRQHFKEVLEFMESLEIPYRVNTTLIQNKDLCCQTIFEIREAGKDDKTGDLLAFGARHSQIAKKSGFKKDVPIVTTTFCFKKKVEPKKYSVSKLSKPKFYFVQIGPDAKYKSLKVIETLRQAGIPIYHSLTKDKLLSQLQTAENLKVPYLVIMGQKEALENSVIIRDVNTREQDTIAIVDLPRWIKKNL